MKVRELIENLLQLDMDSEIQIAIEEEELSAWADIDYVCDWYGDKVNRIVCHREGKEWQ